MAEVLSLQDAVKDYGSKVIGPVSFSVQPGEIVGFLGPNGSGKSTSIRLLLGLMRPTSGKVRLMDKDPLSDHIHALKDVGYSPELPNLQSFLSPRDLLRLTAKELGLGDAQAAAQITVLLDTVGLIQYADYKIAKLSKGMVQRLSVAQSMVGSPRILILDEPMIGIDPAGVVQFRSVFKQFVSNGGTILMSSHILSEVEELCTSLAVIHSGKLVFRGTVEGFIQESLSHRSIVVTMGAPGADNALVRRVSGIAGVDKVTTTADGFLVEALKGSDPRSEIARAVVESGARLLGLGYSRSELDEAYITAIRGPRQ